MGKVRVVFDWLFALFGYLPAGVVCSSTVDDLRDQVRSLEESLAWAERELESLQSRLSSQRRDYRKVSLRLFDVQTHLDTKLQLLADTLEDVVQSWATAGTLLHQMDDIALSVGSSSFWKLEGEVPPAPLSPVFQSGRDGDIALSAEVPDGLLGVGPAPSPSPRTRYQWVGGADGDLFQVEEESPRRDDCCENKPEWVRDGVADVEEESYW